MVLGGSVTVSGSPFISLDEFKQLKLGVIFLNLNKRFVMLFRFLSIG